MTFVYVLLHIQILTFLSHFFTVSVSLGLSPTVIQKQYTQDIHNNSYYD